MRVCAWLLVLLCTLPARGETIYASLANGDITVLDTVQRTSGVVAHTYRCWFDIAFAPDGRLYGSDTQQLFLIDPGSGDSSLIGAFGTFINGLTFVGNTLYASGDIWLYTINLSSGEATRIGTTNYGSSGDLQWFQGALYMTAFTPWNDQLVRLDPADGHAELIGDIGFRSVYGLAASQSQLFGVTQNGDLLAVDVKTGAGIRLGGFGGSAYGASSTPQEIPEPSGFLLLGSGLIAVGMRLKRR